ncbi:hypothetical protein B0H13DRAFT_1905214 [Mycena leptocephala]|nr:hypothetical protein B0H13DRAFT_1905214 [Mycena leptocephala]
MYWWRVVKDASAARVTRSNGGGFDLCAQRRLWGGAHLMRQLFLWGFEDRNSQRSGYSKDSKDNDNIGREIAQRDTGIARRGVVFVMLDLTDLRKDVAGYNAVGLVYSQTLGIDFQGPGPGLMDCSSSAETPMGINQNLQVFLPCKTLQSCRAVVHLSGHPLDLHFKAFLPNEREDRQRQAATKAIITGRQKSGAHAPTPIFSADRLNSWKTRDDGTVTHAGCYDGNRARRTSDLLVRALLPTGARWPILMRLTPVLALPHAAANFEGGIRGRASTRWHLHSAWGRGCLVNGSVFSKQPCALRRCKRSRVGGIERGSASRSGACVHASPEPIHADHDNCESLNATGQIPLGQAEGPARRRRDRRIRCPPSVASDEPRVRRNEERGASARNLAALWALEWVFQPGLGPSPRGRDAGYEHEPEAMLQIVSSCTRATGPRLVRTYPAEPSKITGVDHLEVGERYIAFTTNPILGAGATFKYR